MKEHQIDSFDLTQRTIFGLLGRHLFGAPFVPEADVDWKAVFQESRQQAVCNQVFADCSQLSGLDGEMQNALRSHLVRGMMKNMQVHAQHTELHRLMTEHGIPYVILKGAASARYYPDPQSRAMGDVDFYVGEADFDRALEVCREAGFEASGLDHICHVILRKGCVHMEMHRMPSGVPNGAVGEIVKEYLSNLREEAQVVSSPLVTCCCPSDFHHGLVMLMHFQNHLLMEGIGLRHLCDWAVFVHHLQEDAFLQLFRDRLKKVGLWQLACILTMCAVQYLGLPEQAWIQEETGETDVAPSLMLDILAGGNFGKKDSQRAYEGVLISNRKKDGAHNNCIREAFQTLNRITRKKYPIIEEYPILLPFGWGMAWGGYLLRSNQRNKHGVNVHSLSAYQKSTQRIRIYEKLRIYEPEQ